MIRPTKSMEIHKNIIILYILYVCMWLISMFGLLSHCRMIISGNFLGTTEDSNHADKNLECRFAANPEYPLHNLICTEYPNNQHKRISFKTALSLGNAFIYSAPKHPPTYSLELSCFCFEDKQIKTFPHLHRKTSGKTMITAKISTELSMRFDLFTIKFSANTT